MPAFHPVTQPTGVGTSGVIAAVPILPGFRRFKVKRAIVAQIAGSALSFSVHITTDPTGANHLKTVASVFGAGSQDPADFDNGGEGYQWDADDSGGVLYVHIIPSNGSDNDYDIRLHLGRSL
jgi:hypothetical protein